jgi:DNA-binding PadR family transcriptional regulator
VLAQLRTEHYGHLRKALEDRGLSIDGSTLYPLLRRLRPGARWSANGATNKRTKRFYRLSADGKVMLKELMGEWRSINASVARIFGRRSAA